MASQIKYDPNKKPKFKNPTEKQKAAWTRNWKVRQLRAYYHLCPPSVSKETREKIQKLIDKEPEKLGAEPESVREAKRREELEKL